MKVWILDECSMHIATITGDEADVVDYVNTFYFPNGMHDTTYKVDTIGPRCVNAAFDNNQNAEIIEL